ncbi:hypothetical protein [Amycolatopsis sp. BJA-103]|uniref:hypothetical protein n=1 Tax=unclassified Amycolatopsis TaxID=2618356 RepID=UPI000CA2AD59|nr:hypothetical protein [Amycolatopsis sp. BJA-103]AUI62968.1 hypothetical protein BKN51_35705 [Amycolatopsis sp. BJA-103]
MTEVGGSTVEVVDGVTVRVTVRGAGVLVRVMVSGSGTTAGKVTVTGPTEREVDVGEGVVLTSWTRGCGSRPATRRAATSSPVASPARAATVTEPVVGP